MVEPEPTGRTNAPAKASKSPAAVPRKSPWEVFARAEYGRGPVETDDEDENDDDGDHEDSSRKARGERSARSWVAEKQAELSDEQSARVREAVFAYARYRAGPPADVLERIAKATGPAIYEESLQTRSGALLVTLCVRAARPTTEPIEIENDAEPQEPAPVLEDQLQGVAWLAGEQLVVLDGAIGTGTGGCHSWHLRDVVDIDEDGNPEVVLIRYDEDVEEFQIESIIDGGGVYRWSGVLPAV